MEQVITANVLGIQRGNVDGNKYASIFVLEDADPDDENKKGMMPMKMNCSHDLLEKVRAQDLPGDFDISVKLVPAAGGKLGMKAVGLKCLKPATAQAQKAS